MWTAGSTGNRPAPFFWQNPLTFESGSAMGHNPRLEALKAADFAHFGATWWPHASYDRLKVVTFLAVWVSFPVHLIKMGVMVTSRLLSCSLGTTV